MKSFTVLCFLILSFNVMASATCYSITKQGEELGQLCLDKSIEFLSLGEFVNIQGHIGDANIDHNYIRLQDASFQNCRRPKDKPPVCIIKREAWLKLPINKDLVPQAPSDLFFVLPDFEKGHFGSYELILNTEKI